MSQETTFDLTAESLEAMQKLGRILSGIEEYLPRWTRYAFMTEADDFAFYVKEQWLYGRTISRGSGLTYSTIRPFVPSRYRRQYRNGLIYYNVHPGVSVWGSLNYHGRLAKDTIKVFGRTVRRQAPKREFMRPAALAYMGSHDVSRRMVENYDSGVNYLKRKEGVS